MITHILFPASHLMLVPTQNAVQPTWRKTVEHPRSAIGRVRVMMPSGPAFSCDGRTWEPAEVTR